MVVLVVTAVVASTGISSGVSVSYARQGSPSQEEEKEEED